MNLETTKTCERASDQKLWEIWESDPNFCGNKSPPPPDVSPSCVPPDSTVLVAAVKPASFRVSPLHGVTAFQTQGNIQFPGFTYLI